MSAAETADIFCPYVGLDPFRSSHADYFFGRELDSGNIADHLISRSVTVLYGNSGVGKSSVLNVGVPRALAELGLEEQPQIFRRWVPTSLVNSWFLEATAKPKKHLFLVLDQFEEFFLYRNETEIEEFSKDLRRLLRNFEGNSHILIALRSDALHLLDGMRPYLPQIYDTTLELTHLEVEAVREAVEGPIHVYNERHRKEKPPIRLDPGLAEYLTDENNWQLDTDLNKLQRHIRIELPFLQLALTKLWDKERELRQQGLELSKNDPTVRHKESDSNAFELRVETLKKPREKGGLGGIDGVAAEHVEGQLDAFTRAERRAASKILHYLVTPSGGKIAYSQEDLEKYADTSDLRPVLRKLSEGRILRGVAQAGPESGAARYELYHDKLAKPVLKWRAEYLQNGPFACLRDLFTGEEYELFGSGNLFGRLPKPPDNAYRPPMAQNSISRNHLVILSTFEMLDLRSLNGTTVNATPVALGEPRQVNTGDLIVLANYVPFVFFGVEDEDRINVIPQSARESWAIIIDSTRAVNYISSPEVGLRFDRDKGVAIVRADDPKSFATLSVRLERCIKFKPPKSRPEVKIVTIKDSYNFPAAPVDVEFPRPEDLPETDEFDGARPRFLFEIEDAPFEIIFNPYPKLSS